MGYYLYDASGYLADGPSNRGLEDLVAWGRTQARAYPTISQFLSDGETTNLPALISELNAASAEGAVDDSRVALLDAARQAEGVLILSDGFEDPARSEVLHG